MLGFVIGTACLIGLVKVVRGGRCGSSGACGNGWHARGWHGHGHGWHRGGWGGGGWGGGARGGRRGGFWLRGVFERLDTSPGQEKVIKLAVDELFDATRALRGELDRTRHDIAAAIRSGTVDEVAMGELFARHDEKLREVRKAAIGSIAKVQDALDEDQRGQLADLIERGIGGGWGRFGGGGGGPYRDRSGGGRDGGSGSEWA
jgi:hypothetical protein